MIEHIPETKRKLFISLTTVCFPVLFFSIQLICLFASVLPAQADDISRQEIQAALIIKFTDFIQWPEDSFGKDGEGAEWFTIAVLGDNAYEGLLEAFSDRLFQEKKMRIIHYPDNYTETMDFTSGNIGSVQIIIVSRSEKKGVEALLEAVADRPVLTIGDFPGFAEKGGILNFYPKPNNRVGFEINMDAKNRSGIKISSHLLRLAKIVSQPSKRPSNKFLQ